MAKPGPKGPSKPMSEKEWGQLISMIRIQCTKDEICGVFGMSEPTLRRRIKEFSPEENFDTLFKKHQHEGKSSLRRAQWKSAIELNNVTMQIWLGKQMLNQSDRPQWDDDAGKDVVLQIVRATKPE